LLTWYNWHEIQAFYQQIKNDYLITYLLRKTAQRIQFLVSIYLPTFKIRNYSMQHSTGGGIRSSMTFLVCALLVLSGSVASAQRIEAGFFGGGATYQGDLADDNIQLKETKLAYGGLLRYYLNNSIVLGANFYVGTLTGSDFNNPRTLSRGYTFTGQFNEFALTGEWHFMRPFGRTRSSSGLFRPYFSPFVFLGIGSTTCKAKPVAPVGTTPYPFPEAGDADNFICVPAGIGIKYQFAEQFAIGLELGSRTVFSDYLDGVSKTANPSRNDWYVVGGITLTYTLDDPFNNGR
jgi:hypothetical protein